MEISNILYALIVFVADLMGSFSGLGGGMIIKPMMGMIHQLSLQEIVLYSSIAVFSMSIVSVLKTFMNMSKNKRTIDWSALIFLGLGGVLGGILGDQILQLGFNLLSNKVVNNIQVVMMLLIVGGAIVYQFYSKTLFSIKSKILQLCLGCFLGTISAILGIGGGPLNVMLLMMIMGLSLKDSTVYSLGIVFFSTGSHLLTAFMNGEFSMISLNILLFIIPAAILGGLLGAMIKHKINGQLMKKIYIIMLIGVFILNVFNFNL